MATWYIVENAQQQGPFTDEQFADMVEQGRISANTLVWNETMTEWSRYADVQAARLKQEAERLATGADAGDDAITPLLRRGRAGDEQNAAAQGPVCAECGQSFPADELVPIAGRWICAGCKPLALQKVREGITVVGAVRYAGFWIRVVASIVDGLIMFVVNMLVSFIITAIISLLPIPYNTGVQRDLVTIIVGSITWLTQVALAAVYTTYFLGRFAATPGKMACSIKVIRSDGSSVTYLRALGRHFATMLSGVFTLGIGYLIVAFDAEKRALHDHICDTRVIYR